MVLSIFSSSPFPLFLSCSLIPPLPVGAFSSVFLGTHQNDICAIKKLNVEFNHDSHESKLDVLEKEAGLLSSLGAHPNIIQFKGMCLKDGQYLLVMEFAPGGSLDQLLRKKKDLCFAIIIDWTSQIANGMNHLHS